MTAPCNPFPSLPEDIATAFEETFARSDRAQAAALAGIVRLRAVRFVQLQNELNGLSALEPDHPDLLRATSAVEAERQLSRQLNIQMKWISVPVPRVDDQAWVLHGFVRDLDLEGRPNLTVALQDHAGHWINQLGHACTDLCGYFQLRIQSALRDRNLGNVLRQELFVQISDSDRALRHRDAWPIKVELGRVEYREILLGAENAVCSPPAGPFDEGHAMEVAVRSKSKSAGKQRGKGKRAIAQASGGMRPQER